MIGGCDSSLLQCHQMIAVESDWVPAGAQVVVALKSAGKALHKFIPVKKPIVSQPDHTGA
jgi:hypothetical protein